MGISEKVVCILGGVLLMSSAFAGQKDGDGIFPDPPFGKTNVTEVSKKLEAVEKKVDQISETKISDVLGGNNPSFFDSHGKTGLFTNLSLLCWKGFNNSWVVANELRGPSVTSSGNFYFNVHPDVVDFDWSVGFRVGLGYYSKYDAWNVQGIYTWIRFSGDKKFVAKDYRYINALYSLGISPNDNYTFDQQHGVFRTLSAYWRLNHNVGDLQFARDFFITKALLLQPLLGVRFASLYQAMNAHFGENITLSANDKYFAYHILNSYWGIGPRIGIDGKWTLPHNVGFTGLITGSLLYGKTDVCVSLYGTPSGVLNTFEQTGSQKSNKSLIVPTIQVALGLDWGTFFSHQKFYWGMNLSWEFNYWWNQSNFDTSKIIQGPVEMQGITFRSELHF